MAHECMLLQECLLSQKCCKDPTRGAITQEEREVTQKHQYLLLCAREWGASVGPGNSGVTKRMHTKLHGTGLRTPVLLNDVRTSCQVCYFPFWSETCRQVASWRSFCRTLAALMHAQNKSCLALPRSSHTGNRSQTHTKFSCNSTHTVPPWRS